MTVNDAQAFANWLHGASSGHLTVRTVDEQVQITSDREDYDGEVGVVETGRVCGPGWGALPVAGQWT